MIARLGVNIDHVATLRQARGESYPSVELAAIKTIEAGADQITIHLREDRRHIQDQDVYDVKKITSKFNKPLNLEIGASPKIIDIACDVAPEWVCLVPEKREEKTTEGGLDLISADNFKRINDACVKLKEKNPRVKISLFVEADEKTLKQCKLLNIDAVEIHTGDYAISFNKNEKLDSYLNKYKSAYNFLEGTNIAFHAGHGLTDMSLIPLVEQGLFAEYNIGHWIVSDSVFNGLSNSIETLLEIINKGLKK